MKPGVWVAYYFDFSGFAVFAADDEINARRYAGDRHMQVDFVPFGDDVRHFLYHKHGGGNR